MHERKTLPENTHTHTHVTVCLATRGQRRQSKEMVLQNDASRKELNNDNAATVHLSPRETKVFTYQEPLDFMAVTTLPTAALPSKGLVTLMVSNLDKKVRSLSCQARLVPQALHIQSRAEALPPGLKPKSCTFAYF
jgi:hypothetical protein